LHYYQDDDLSIGSIDDTAYERPIYNVPLSNESYWQIEMSQVWADDQAISMTPSQARFDSRISYIYGSQKDVSDFPNSSSN
jgi:hypothetical protein